MAINIYTVQQDVESKGWTLVSASYKNLKTPIQMRCPKGHDVEVPYENWRKHQTCLECEKLIAEATIRNKIPPPNLSANRVLALDAATNTTGYSIFDDKKLVAYGTFTTTGRNATEKINQVKHWVDDLRQKAKPNFIGIENIQYQQMAGVKTFQTLANLQGVLLDYCFENCESALVMPSTWRAHLGINHGDKRVEAKQKTQSYVKLLTGLEVSQDEADAICIGKYFADTRKTTIKWGEEIE